MNELQPGAAVTPNIRLLRRLDAGGMGSVWIAEHAALRTEVVVKFIAVELAASPEAVERFSREAAAAAQVKSPHVVQVFDHGVTADGVAFIVMEMLEGRDLRKHLASRGRLTLAETAEIVGQLCKALARAHERGIVHRDIKPDNVFLCTAEDGETFVKLLDFGVAKSDARLIGSTGTKTGAMLGTPHYMSPEQVVGEKAIDWRTDLWSLGVLTYECVVGAKPFREQVFGALAIHIHSGPLPIPSVDEPSLPPAFDPWFARACAREVGARFASAKELGDALARVASGADMEPAVSEPIPSPLAHTVGGRPNTNGGVGVSTLAPHASRGGLTLRLTGLALGLVAVVFGAAFAIQRFGTPAPAPMGIASVYPRSAAAPVAPSPPAGEASTQSTLIPAPPATSAVAPATSERPSLRSAMPRPAPSGKAGAALRSPSVPSATPSATSPPQRYERDIF